MSTHLKNGVTADDTGKLVFWWFNTYLREESQRAEEFGIFIVKSVTADGSLLSPTGSVKGMYPAPHIHEHMATANCEPQSGPHCGRWHGHHKAHGRVQCAVLSTPRTVC